jgi:ribosomal protein L28
LMVEPNLARGTKKTKRRWPIDLHRTWEYGKSTRWYMLAHNLKCVAQG